MSKSESATEELNLVLSRIKVGMFLTIVAGLLVLSISGSVDQIAFRSLMLTTLAVVFIIGGGLFGLVSMHHISHTHLPEEVVDDDVSDTPPAHTDPVAALPRKSGGFLGMFASSLENSPDDPISHKRQLPPRP